MVKRISILFWLIVFTFLQLLGQDLTSKDDLNKIRERRESEKSGNIHIENKIDDLLKRMALEEKIGQMIQITVGQFSKTLEYNETADGITSISIDTAAFIPFLNKYPISSTLNGYGFTPENWYELVKSIQELNIEHTRLDIPIIYGSDHQHGANYVHGSTIFPHSINMGATFNRELSKQEGRAVGIETADIGHRMLFGPLVDVGVNPLWPRIYESYGEDSYLVTEMALAFMEGNQVNPDMEPLKQALCAKHFLGYSDPDAGWDRTPANIPKQQLYEIHVPSFKAVIDNGVHTIMLNSGEVSGVPVHSSYEIVTGLLRDELKFKGVVLTDWDDINKMYKYHKTARNAKEATLIAINAGVDMTMAPYDLDFGDYVMELIEEGKISEERIDLSVSRILRMKFQIGLFDNPMPRNDRLNRIGSHEYKKYAKQASEESIVLLKNDGVLPIKDNKKFIVAGINANIKRSLCGGWTYRWMPETDDIFPEEMNTVYTALSEKFGNDNVKLSDIEDIETDAKSADVIVLALGELPHAEGLGNINDILLPKEQKMLAKKAFKTGKEVIILMIGARPFIATEEFDSCKAFIWVGLPGIDGADAITGILTGEVNPSGKMPISYPAYSGHYYNYNHKPSNTNYDIPPVNPRTVIASFGDGLSYSEFKYHSLSISDSILTDGKSLTAKVKVKNVSDIDGKESILWYITDEYARITRPVKELKYFEKKEIGANSETEFKFEVSHEILAYPDENANQIMEPGYFTLQVGGQQIRFRYK